MKEPDLEEEDLRAEVRSGQLTITRRSLTLEQPEVTITLPSGETRKLRLAEEGPGRSTATLAAEQNGLYRITDGTLTTLAAARPLNPRSAERREGKEGVRTCRTRWAPDH